MSLFTPQSIRNAVRAHADQVTTQEAAKKAADRAAAWTKTEARLAIDFGIPVGAAVPTFDDTTRVWSGMLETDFALAGISLRTSVRSDSKHYRAEDNPFGDYLMLSREVRGRRIVDVTAADLADLLDGVAKR